MGICYESSSYLHATDIKLMLWYVYEFQKSKSENHEPKGNIFIYVVNNYISSSLCIDPFFKYNKKKLTTALAMYCLLL